MAIGLAIGTAIGVATDNFGLWLSLGVVMGFAIGNMRNQKENDEET